MQELEEKLETSKKGNEELVNQIRIMEEEKEEYLARLDGKFLIPTNSKIWKKSV